MNDNFYDMSAKMKELFPSNPAADKKALMAMANAPQQRPPETTNYVQESVDVEQGSLQMDKEYSVSDFARLAGVRIDETQKTGSAGQLKGKDKFTKSSTPGGNESPHPARDQLVGEDDELFEPIQIVPKDGNPMASAQRQLKQGMGLIAKGSAMIDEAQAKIKELTSTLSDSTLTKGEEKEKERIVKGMKKKKNDFKDRYGDDAEAVMYATATKNSKKNESIKDMLLKMLDEKKQK